MINPPSPHPLPPNGWDQLSAWLNPRGETEWVTQQDREAGCNGGGGGREGEKLFFFFSLLFLHHSCSGLPSFNRAWQPSLDFPALVSHLSPVSPSLFMFCLWWKNICNSISISLSFSPLCTLTSQSIATEIQIHRSNSLKQRSDYYFVFLIFFFFLLFHYLGLHFQDLYLTHDKTWNSLSWLFFMAQKVTMVKSFPYNCCHYTVKNWSESLLIWSFWNILRKREWTVPLCWTSTQKSSDRRFNEWEYNETIWKPL